MRPGPSGSKMKAVASAVSWRRAGSGRRCSRPFVLDVPFEVRVERLVRADGRYDTDRMVNGAIGKRLGSLRAKQARQAVCDGALYDACRHLLAYYDKAYRYHLEQRDTTKRRRVLLPASPTPDTLADELLETALV